MGGANFVALGEVAGADDTMMASMVIPDVMVGSIWMGALLYMAGVQHKIDARTGANTQAIRDLEQRMTEFQERVKRNPDMPDYLMMLALAFGAAWISFKLGAWLPELAIKQSGVLVSHGTWKYILVTTFGVVLSFTPARRLEGVGASKIGSVMIYLLVTCIGASANFNLLTEAPGLIVMGLIWIFIHITVLLTVAWLIKAPIFFVAVGSQANIGGAASAPVVAAAYHPSLAPVGALLAVAGYVLGTYAGLVCMHLLKFVAGAS